jgi:type VI secretion system protein VasD
MASEASSAGSSGGMLGALGDMTNTALSAVGLRSSTPDTSDLSKLPDASLPDRHVNWRIYASDSLNVDENNQPLALVIRIYKLKSPDAFLLAPLDVFGDATKEKSVFGDDLVAVREIQLLPGQHHESMDKVPRDARYVGIVALFRRPATGKWRYAFSAEAADKTGLTLGAHACAMSVQNGEAIGVGSARSAAVPCPDVAQGEPATHTQPE